jgi:hypothetical protein
MAARILGSSHSNPVFVIWWQENLFELRVKALNGVLLQSTSAGRKKLQKSRNVNFHRVLLMIMRARFIPNV